ncbi:hypothetical protein [Polyangium fumosum]|uniref:PepSY domain-containing protein n=1 Tax=Polyangium fumosum TaxID=889272 RepID=A0A4U1JHP3_9BACT|nr:hypothetical protein [Polyangium fumosum]TKD11948.1 hypothetical protein E8A74_07430 [Polyangium fumosum]
MKRMFRALLASLAIGLIASPALAVDEHAQKTLSEQYKDAKKTEVAFANLPTPAQNAIRTWAEGGEIKKVEQITLKDGQIHYKAEIKKGKEKLQVAVTADGKTVARGEKID